MGKSPDIDFAIIDDLSSNVSEPQYAGRFPKISKKPEKGWRSSLSYGVSVTPKKTPKAISQVGKRTKERIKANGSESELFARVWNSRPHTCEICGIHIGEPKPECFSHKLGKGRYPALRYEPRNISLVCSMECHHENDRRNSGNDLELIQQILG